MRSYKEISRKTHVCEISSSHGGEYDVQSCLLGCAEDNSEHTYVSLFLFVL
jgi:hypothetical protein